VKKGAFDEKLFVPVGYGDKKPLASHKTKEGRRTNRRIEVIIED
jgi:flagellar motor protein MotB